MNNLWQRQIKLDFSGEIERITDVEKKMFCSGIINYGYETLVRRSDEVVQQLTQTEFDAIKNVKKLEQG